MLCSNSSISSRPGPSRSVRAKRKSAAHCARVAASLSSSSVNRTSPLAASTRAPAQRQDRLRAKPCLGRGPRSLNCGRQTGTPPRMADWPSNRALGLRYRRSRPAPVQDSTWAPCKATSRLSSGPQFRRRQGWPRKDSPAAASSAIVVVVGTLLRAGEVQVAGVDGTATDHTFDTLVLDFAELLDVGDVGQST